MAEPNPLANQGPAAGGGTAPSGLQQVAADANPLGNQGPSTYLGQVAQDEGLASAAQGWYTGANQQGMENGWDNTLIPRFLPEWNKALEEGNAAEFFNRDDATGIVTWDHEGVDAKTNTKVQREFGDIYDNGERVGNIYELPMEGFDKDVANQVMSHLVLTGEQQSQIWADGDRLQRLDREIQAERSKRTEAFSDFQSQVKFQGKVEERAEDFREQGVGEAIAGGAAVAGGALAQGVVSGLRVPGPPQVKVGAALIGGIYSGASAWLNRDALTEQLARSYEITALSADTEGSIAGIMTGINQFSGFGAKLLSPHSNMVQGITDAAGESRTGDGTADFYRTDATGERTVSKWVRGLDVVATVGDSLMQFASPIGLQLYSAQMTGVIGGEVGELAFTGGKAFDYRSGSFDNIFTDDEGNADLSAAAAGIGKVGIDVVQLGMARGLAGKTNALRTDAGVGSLYGTLQRYLPQSLGGTRGLADDVTRVRSGGHSYLQAADGTIIEGSRKMSLAMLAPSEQLTSLSSRVTAMRMTAKKSGALTADDFYRASQALASGERKIQTTLVNAMGEGYEEGMQSFLEQHSHGHEPDWAEIGNSALYGFAAGAGMGLGYAVRTPTADMRLFAQANLAQMSRMLPPITEKEWAGLSQTEKVSRSQLAAGERALMESAARKRAANMAADMTAGTAGTHKWLDAYEAERARLLGRGNDRVNGSYVITQIESAGRTDANGDLLPGEFPADAVVGSGIQITRILDDHYRGIAAQIASLQRDVADFTARMADPNDPAAADLGEMLAETQAMLEKAEVSLTWGLEFRKLMDAHLARMYAATATDVEIDAESALLNKALLDAFHLRLDMPGVAMTRADRMGLARAVGAFITRDPQDQSGSYQLLVPQISGKLTAAHSDDVLEVSHAILGAIRGDYDGDKVRPQNELILDDEEFTSARAGMHFVGAGTSVNVGTPKWEPHNIAAMAEALRDRDPTMALYAEQSKIEITNAIRRRYSGVVDDTILDEIFQLFYAQIEAGEPKARSVLMDGLANNAGAQITEFARGNLSNEWLWLDNLIVGSLQKFQTTAARYRPLRGEIDDSVAVPVPRAPSDTAKERAVRKSATLGNTLDLLTAGVDPFRQDQKIHYSVLASPVLSALGLDVSDTRLGELALAYRELGTRITRAEIEEITAKDEITGRVLVQLRRLTQQANKLDAGLGENEAMAVIANLQVLDIDIDDQGQVTGNNNRLISLTQFLLKQSIRQDQRDKAAILEASPELQAKHARLEGMTRPGKKGKPGRSTNAQRAFVEVVGSMQLIDLLGSDASDVLAPHLTVEQYVRLFTDMSSDARTELKAKLQRSDPLGEQGIHDMPFSLEDVRAGRISSYRAVVDAITTVGNGRISIDLSGKGTTARGKMSGEYVDMDRSVTENFDQGHATAVQVIDEFIAYQGRKDGETREQTIARLLEAHPDFANKVMALLPNAVTNAIIFRRDDGEFVIANWVYRMLATKDTREAEMIYWREIFYAERAAMNFAGLEAEAAEADEEYTRVDSLSRRIHRLVYNLAKQNDGGLALQRFQAQLEDSRNLQDFFTWLNTEPTLRMPVPLLAWVDDVAMFDADKAGGGWTTTLEGAELREAVAALRRSGKMVLEDIRNERTAFTEDTRTLQQIQNVLDYDAGKPGATLPTDDARELHDQLQERINQAGLLGIGLGPQAMVYQTVFAASGFYPSAHTKGQNPPHLEALGSFEAMRDAFGYTSNYNRVLAALTSTDLSAVSNSMSELARVEVRTMDEDGTESTWSQPTVQGMLDLLKSPSSRAMARSILYPQVVERGQENQVSRQLLVGKSLKGLLDGTSLKEMFPAKNKLSLDSALRYVSMLETLSRQFGGHFSVQRWANEIVIAKTTSADHVLSVEELEQLTIETYHQIARVMQSAGSIGAAAFDIEDPLTQLRADVKTAQRKLRLAANLNRDVSEVELTDKFLQSSILQMQTEAEEQKVILASTYDSTDPAQALELERRVAAIDTDVETFSTRLKLLMSDDMVGEVVEMFRIPVGTPYDPTYIAHKREVIRDYVLARMNNFTERATATLSIVDKMVTQLQDAGRADQIELSDEEWETLSRAVISVYLDEVASYGISPVAVFPDIDKVSDHRYWDVSFAYLADPALDRSSPIMQAAIKLHRLAGRQGAPVPLDSDLVHELGNTILDPNNFGAWTSDVPRAAIEANKRIDSSAASVAISIYGQSPKTEAVFTAATRRTFETQVEGVDIATLLSKSSLTWDQLDATTYDDIPVEFPDGTVVNRPLVELNNRFVRSVQVVFVDNNGQDQDINLLAYRKGLGQPFASNQKALNSGYVSINVDRLKKSVNKLAGDFNLNPDQVRINVEFFHPDTKPGGPGWANNLYFEGTSFRLDADRHDSLNGTLWFANESISPAGQAAALDANKLGLPALNVITPPSYTDAARMEQGWDTDLAAVLRAKTREVFNLKYELNIEAEDFWNAVHKNMKLRHFVRGFTPGTETIEVWTADQVIAHQVANPGVALPLEQAELWVPTDEVLRSLLGEQGTQGLNRAFASILEHDLSKVPRFREVTPAMIESFPGMRPGERVDLKNTVASSRARQQQLQVRGHLDKRTLSIYAERLRYFDAARIDEHAERYKNQNSATDPGFNANRNLNRTKDKAVEYLYAENIALDWGAANIFFIGPRDISNNLMSAKMIADLNQTLEENQYRAGWEYVENGVAQVAEGVLSRLTLEGGQKGMRVTPGDIVLMRLDSFEGNVELMEKRIDHFISKGVIIIPVSSDSETDMRAHAMAHLLENDYSKIAGSKYVFQPSAYNSRYRSQQARMSTLTEVQAVSPRNHALLFHVRGLPIQENAAWAKPADSRIGAVRVSMNLVPINAFVDYNAPVTPDQIDDVRAQLRAMNNPEGKAFLRKQSNSMIDKGPERDFADAQWDIAWDRLMDRFDNYDGVVMPQPDEVFGTGDFIPLLNTGGRILLYRHGHKAPRSRYDINEMSGQQPDDTEGAVNIASYTGKRNPAATTHTGRVVRTHPRSGFGLSIELDIDLQQFGDKVQLEFNGMKYVLAPTPKGVELLDHGVFENWDISMISDFDSLESKEGFDGMLNNHRTAFMFFGIDFSPYIAEFFFPGEGQSTSRQREAKDLMHRLSRRLKTQSVSDGHADQLMKTLAVSETFRDLVVGPAADMSGLVDPSWAARLSDGTVASRIALAMMIYLATPGGHIDQVWQTGGFNDTSTGLDDVSLKMPRMFTQVFDMAGLSDPLRLEMNAHFNRQLHNPNKKIDGSGHRLHPSFQFEVRHGAGDPRNMVGYLQVAEVHSSGDNPLVNGMSFDILGRQQVSQHSAAIAYQSTGAQTATKYDIARAREFYEARNIPRFETEEMPSGARQGKLTGGVWEMLAKTDPKDKSTTRNWRILTPGEQMRMETARAAMVLFRKEIDKTGDLWEVKGGVDYRREYEDLVVQISTHLGLKKAQRVVVDFWVRQVYGENDRISGKAAVEVAKEIRDSVVDGYLPVISGQLPLLHVHDLQMIYRAQRSRPEAERWAPNATLEPGSEKASTWRDWVHVSVGGAFTLENLFDPFYLLALDGLMHSYQNATHDLIDLPVTMDRELNALLMHPETNKMLVSIDPGTQQIATDPGVMNMTRASLEDMVKGNRMVDGYASRKPPASEIAKKRAKMRRWRKENNVPVPVPGGLKDLRKNGMNFVEESTRITALTRMLIHLRIGTALINPALYVSMGPEQWMRGSLDRIANVLSMQGTTGGLSRLQAGVSERAVERGRKAMADYVAEPKTGEAILNNLYADLMSLPERTGLVHRYTTDQLKGFNDLFNALGESHAFAGMVFSDMMFIRPEHGRGRFDRWLANYAKFGSRLQDPTYGVRQKTLARRYIDGAIQHIQALPTIHNISIDTLIAEMKINATFLKDNFPDAHAAGLNAAADIRSLKQTIGSATLRGIIEPLSESSNTFVNFSSNVFLKLPFLFMNYAANVGTTITGMQAISAMAAMGLHGRDKKFLGRLQTYVRGKHEESDDYFDMTEVMEGIDLSRAFIRGGITHTGLFVTAMMAGGIGMFGEDDEARRRRLLAENQGLGVIYDPRDPRNSFLNADAIYLDWLPFGLGEYGTEETGGGLAMAQPHWILRQVFSPMMGIDNFIRTGDVRHVQWGFEDAISSFPIINSLMWKDAVETGNQLADLADAEAKVGGDENLISAGGFLTTMVAHYERMLFESSFANAIYVGRDRYDRDPYLLALRDATGEINTDIEGQARPNDIALSSYVDPETGEVKQGYMKRNDADALLHSLTENRFTLAAVSSLFSGITGLGDTDYFRYQMPIKTREFDNKTLTRKEVEDIVYAQFVRNKGTASLTLTEAEAIAKREASERYDTTGVWTQTADIMARAREIAQGAGGGAMSIHDEAGNEKLTLEGAQAVIRGLLKKTVAFGDESLQGVYIPFDMRQKIAAEWSRELIQEGIDLGLDHSKATTRMKRIMGGPFNTDEPGLSDLLFSDQLGYEPSRVYKQLNTTYTQGPDGKFWATGWTRDGLMGALGMKPFNRQIVPEQSAMTWDASLNSVDQVNQANLGLRGLELLDKTEYVPTDKEIGDAIIKAIEDAAKQQYTPFQPFRNNKSGGGFGYGGFGGGGGGGGSSYGYPNFTRMYPLPDLMGGYGNTIPFINTSNPILRRASVRRERVWSERGRLKQWQ